MKRDSCRLLPPFILILVLLFSTACGTEREIQETATPTLLIITATLPPTQTPRASPTQEPATSTPPVEPVEGQTTSQLNVRSAPSAASESLGMLNIFTTVQIVGKDPSTEWWMIRYPEGPGGIAWVTAQYVQIQGSAEVPVIGEQPQPATQSESATATVIETVNVRSSPGTNDNAIGTINAGETVILTGKDSSGSWLQILFSGGEDGKGWVSAAFMQTQGLENLPVLTEAGQLVGTETPAAPFPGATPTVVPAFLDGDSAQSPGVSVTLTQSALRSFNYSSDVSAPEGDVEDWVQFGLAGVSDQQRTVSVVLDCWGNSALNLELIQGGSRLQGWEDLTCDRRRQLILTLFVGAPYFLRVLPAQDQAGLHYVDYTLIVSLR